MSNRLLALGFFAVLAGSQAAQAQDEPKVFLREERPHAPADKNFREALAQPATAAPLTDSLKRDIEVVVRHAVYPMADPDKKVQNTPQLMSRTVDAAAARTLIVFTSMESKNTAVQDEFLRKMLEALELLLLNEQQLNITRVNAGRLLSRVAAITAREEIADLAIKVVAQPKQVEGARYYALQGLKELLKSMAVKGNAGIKQAKRKADVVTALVAFIERQPPFVPNTPEEEEGLRMIRREAIRALSEVRVPLVAGDPKGHAALTLCRVAGKDGSLLPEPRLDEQVEAAVGLCRLPPDPQKELQVGYVAFQVARFVAELANAAQKRAIVREPWKLHAARLNDALKAMQAAHEGDATVKTVAGLSATVLQSVERGQDANLSKLIAWIEDTQKELPQKSVYKGDEKSVVTPRGAGAER